MKVSELNHALRPRVNGANRDVVPEEG